MLYLGEFRGFLVPRTVKTNVEIKSAGLTWIATQAVL